MLPIMRECKARPAEHLLCEQARPGAATAQRDRRVLPSASSAGRLGGTEMHGLPASPPSGRTWNAAQKHTASWALWKAMMKLRGEV
jgi:hypothetical protein